jgi:putative membrane-bound dehydrogenase-like protein
VTFAAIALSFSRGGTMVARSGPRRYARIRYDPGANLATLIGPLRQPSGSSPMKRRLVLSCICLALAASARGTAYTAGTGVVDVTPDFPVRLSGYGSRTEETMEIDQRLYVKALAIQSGKSKPAVLITADNCALSLAIGDEVCARLEKKRGLGRERVAINFSHTHCAPMLTDVIPNLFSKAIPPEHQARIDQYTQLMIDSMEKAALQALDAMAPATLHFGIGSAGFGTNRRTPGGPVDHDLPLLCVKGADGAVRALVAGYACHCTTLSYNRINGDWAGYAQAAMQAAYPGAVGMVTIGCGADQNPIPRGTVEHAAQYGAAIADGVKKAMDAGLRELQGEISCALARTPLAFGTHPTRTDWEERAKEESPRGYHARVQLAKLDRGETLASEIPYTVQRFAFGDDLAMLFLAGEVVVDYSTRFKIEYDRARLWVCGYSNDVPCYIPSSRILQEGGYEGADAMIYYNQPARFAADVEDRIATAVHAIMPENFRNTHEKTGGFAPLRPYDALHAFVLPDGYEAQLVACEPHVVDPVAVDFAPDGALFVAEMNDYNRPPEQSTPPRGRVRRLTDTNGDGFFDQSSIYLDGLVAPTGVTVWRGGVLVCAAPEILYAEDTNSDGVADIRKVLFTGFADGNSQARVNSLAWGLDNWMYGGGGLLGGRIARGDGQGEPVTLGGRDFRLHPDTLTFETATGNSQYGRARDDWDNWFGCDSSNLLKFHALPEHVLAKAPNVAPPPATVVLAGPPYDVYPVSSHVDRFNDPDDLNRVTSACGLAIYRDELLGEGFRGNAFNCEPVHNLVTRLAIAPAGASFTARRAPGEEQSEFIASKDHWFRPAQVRTGPDGALWVVDMYRYVVEHAKWITPDRREALDMFAGENMGRIYRIKRTGEALRPVQDLGKLDTPGLVLALDTPNGTVRDLVHQALLWRADPAAQEALRALANDTTKREDARTHALCILDGLGVLDVATLAACATEEAPPGLRRHALRLIGPRLEDAPGLLKLLKPAVNDNDAVIAEAALLGLAGRLEKRDTPLIASALAGQTDPYVIAAALIASSGRAGAVAREYVAQSPRIESRAFQGLARLAAAEGAEDALRDLLLHACALGDIALVQLVADAAIARGYSLTNLAGHKHDKALGPILANARVALLSPETPDETRVASLNLLARADGMAPDTLAAFERALSAQSPADVQLAAIKALSGRTDDVVADFLLQGLSSLGPQARDAALDALARRAGWCAKLLDHLESAPEARRGLRAERKQFLLRHPDIDLRTRAQAILGAASAGQRAAVLEKYKEVETLTGDPRNGLQPFEERCAQCHLLGKTGHALGPDLSALTDKSAAALLKAILDPNETVLEQYQSFTVETKDLRTLSGIVADESATSITLKMAGGLQETLLRGDIERMTNTAVSLMPEGVEENLSPAQLADIVAFIQTNPPSPKNFKGNTPALISRGTDGVYALTAENGAIFGGPDMEYRPRFGAVGGWSSQADRVEWEIEIAEGGTFGVMLTWTSPPGAAGTPWRLTDGAATIDGALESTGGWEHFELRDVGMITLQTGRRRLQFSPLDVPKDGMMELRSISLKPVSK